MGRRKTRKVIRRMPKRIPRVFRCPHCGEPSIIVEMDRAGMQAEVKCGRCQTKATIPIHRLSESVDVYAKFLDKYYEGAISPPKEVSVAKPEDQTSPTSGSAQPQPHSATPNAES